jgi:dihydroflavonol-4-reductase
MDVEVHEGELHEPEPLARALRGVDAVIHAAGATSCDWADWPLLQACNVHGTEALLKAAMRSGVGRMVYTSSTATVGSHATPGCEADESQPLSGWRERSPYARSKQQAEQLLLDQRELPVIVLNLAEVVGPWDHSLQWGRIVLATALGQLPFVPPGSATFCSAGDAASAHLRALDAGQPGERYIVGAESMSIRDFLALAGQAAFAEPLPLSRRPWILLRATSSWRQRLRGMGLHRIAAPVVDPYRMRVFGGHHLFSDAKAQQAFGHRCQPLHEAVAQCHNWYLAHGFLPGHTDAGPTEGGIHAH